MRIIRIAIVVAVALTVSPAGRADAPGGDTDDLRVELDEETGRWVVYEVVRKADLNVPDEFSPTLLDAAHVGELYRIGRTEVRESNDVWISQVLPFVKMDRAFIVHTLELEAPDTVRSQSRREVVTMLGTRGEKAMMALATFVFLIVPLLWLGYCFFTDPYEPLNIQNYLLNAVMLLSIIAGCGFFWQHLVSDPHAAALLGGASGMLMSLLVPNRSYVGWLKVIAGAAVGMMSALVTTTELRVEYAAFVLVIAAMFMIVQQVLRRSRRDD